ncbi:effector protein Tle3 domain-containing protein [Paraburkholderia sp. J76]|uniref:T6SS effector phospholipase Tle3 domain-containing protein n=1 Tax=Paraburkholderia sp. J76 TaxID=2805439 RepID=UPI002ABDD4F8|nr:DUF3274 domain-containing protein [Paraburkholderia sp. J76]
MSDTNTANSTLRNSKQGQQAMPMPAGSGAMLTCKVPVKPPMPCTVIAIHGVNDDGQFFPVVDEFICKGLNARLGRDDLYAHEWAPWKPLSESSLPELDASTQHPTVAREQGMTICREGRSPVIPFHWGYRPVDVDNYRKEQQRYASDLKAGYHDPNLPYNAYFLGPNPSTDQYGDNLGNWLNAAKAKDGGPFPNATTNLVDMWGPGPSGAIYGAGALKQRDPAARLHDNPHRIYYVHAARRLADLILLIRTDKSTASDTINIIAHSQGTEISMLANFMVMDAGVRPVDCLIMCNSPYGLYPTEAELGMPGLHQSTEARKNTLANFTRLMHTQPPPKPLGPADIVKKGIASADAWSKPENSRSSTGCVYNYFCPQDTVVSLPNIQGIGWQGVDQETFDTLGPSFYQRVFSDGHVVGTGDEEFVLGGKSKARLALEATTGLPGMLMSPIGKTPLAGIIDHAGEKRKINGPKLPETYTFHTLRDGKDTGDKLGEHLAGTALADGARKDVLRLVDVATGAETEAPGPGASAIGMYGGQLYDLNAAKTQLLAARYPYANLVRTAWRLSRSANVSSSSQLIVLRSESNDEALNRLAQMPAEWSQHSAITLSAETVQKCMAYDLAIGLSVAFDNETMWWKLIHRADWRSKSNEDLGARKYFTDGILPDAIKPQMNKPSLPSGVESHVAPSGGFKTAKALLTMAPLSALAPVAVLAASRSPVDPMRPWSLPEPDLKT